MSCAYQLKSPIETPSKNGFIFSFHSFKPIFFDGFDIQITANTIPGMKSEGNTCNDIDECAEGIDTCEDVIETCVNKQGSYECQCSDGYARDNDGVCADINECADGTHTCADTIETCMNNVGSYDCPCSSGYERIDGICVDIDECALEIDDCHAEKDLCENRQGTYECIRLPMPYEEAIRVIQDWIGMTSEVLELAKHDRAGKFDNRAHKLQRNALKSYKVDCSAPFSPVTIGQNHFGVWEKDATRSADVCEQTTTMKAGLNAWVINYACNDESNKRKAKRVAKFTEKLTNPYC